jgi:death-on-curing family protein
LPASRRTFALSAPYIEIIHDSFVSALWPNIEPVGPDEFRDRGLVQSAVARPFQVVFGRRLFRTLPEKAAALFHSLIATHPFDNGNKRTAVIALDLFLTANGQFLYLDNEDMYRLAVDTASYVPRGISHEQMLARITEEVRRNTMDLARMEKEGFPAGLAESVKSIRKDVRRNSSNRSVQGQFYCGAN